MLDKEGALCLIEVKTYVSKDRNASIGRDSPLLEEREKLVKRLLPSVSTKKYSVIIDLRGKNSNVETPTIKYLSDKGVNLIRVVPSGSPLKPKYIQVLEDQRQQGLTLKEIARKRGLTVKQVYDLLRYAKNAERLWK